MNEIDLIKENYCIGCGICTTTGLCRIQMDILGKYKVEIIQDGAHHEILDICPFSSYSQNEDNIGSRLFSSDTIQKSDSIGYFLDNYIGFVIDDKIRLNSSSGGIITWLLDKLIDEGNITHAIHVGPSDDESLLFKYTISDNKESILAGASSKYYPVEMTEVLRHIRLQEGKYAIVVLPCFAKGLRLLQQKDKVFNERIKYIISPFCGHLKTANYAKFLSWQTGILPSDLLSINFRRKMAHKLASQYGTEVISKKGVVSTIENTSLKMGTDWGHGMFKYPACDFCDDIVGEVADISVGDAWLPQFINDYKGSSVLIVRNKYLNQIIKDGEANEELVLENTTPEIVRKSQAGGIRNKREDLKYRLWIKEQKGEWYPPKRVAASENHIDSKRKRVIQLRLRISQYSHCLFIEALSKNKLSHFYSQMKPLLNQYYIRNFGIIRFLKHRIKNILWN